VAVNTGSRHWICDLILSSSILGHHPAAYARAAEVMQQEHDMQCKNTSTTPSGWDMMPIGFIVATFHSMILHVMAAAPSTTNKGGDNMPEPPPPPRTGHAQPPDIVRGNCARRDVQLRLIRVTKYMKFLHHELLDTTLYVVHTR
jgi:hypothetical protein